MQYFNIWFSLAYTQLIGFEKIFLETRGIDPRTSHMLSERSTIWATSPVLKVLEQYSCVYHQLTIKFQGQQQDNQSYLNIPWTL